MTDAVIVGGGLFGQVIAKALRDQGRSVVVLDSRERDAGSRPAACLMKPSWFSSMGRDVYQPALELLDRLYGVQDIVFGLRPRKIGANIGSATVHWIPPSEILSGSTQNFKVTDIIRRGGAQGGWHLYCWSDKKDLKMFEASLVVVAAGIWTSDILHEYQQQGQKGAAFVIAGARVKDPFIWPYAPYRQLVAFNRGDGLWVGDGTAIKQENWATDRERISAERCGSALGLGTLPPETMITGIRPYAKGHKPCLLEEVQPGLWVASGGAKNGTVAAGWCAHVIRERTS